MFLSLAPQNTVVEMQTSTLQISQNSLLPSLHFCSKSSEACEGLLKCKKTFCSLNKSIDIVGYRGKRLMEKTKHSQKRIIIFIFCHKDWMDCLKPSSVVSQYVLHFSFWQAKYVRTYICLFKAQYNFSAFQVAVNCPGILIKLVN